ncbi:uncharacterized protein AMSG_11299 [Thecamonas trahens ATCC 50062]|uniref:DH domain-containing protein n=1 Tax=Thecamonas trahens ATCC 50062 TaxID=461836 RepID=A0A0L0DUA6_THETB|nr:hypothetical protein AMSG_11299 [Thecamonas trahens ATCC 50062]KNC55855.1 hypothetical protein AMSG_11299 [Thecamonas trahens ATCC 50062]|eukprot:XP_013752781.1 hypothetical protein AMSG_11299 [Thecamonas trahens ATCC 50062]
MSDSASDDTPTTPAGPPPMPHRSLAVEVVEPDETPIRIVRTLQELAEVEVSYLSKLYALKHLREVCRGKEPTAEREVMNALVPHDLIMSLYVIHTQDKVLLPSPLDLASASSYFDNPGVTANLSFYVHYVAQWETITGAMQAANARPAFRTFCASVLDELPGLDFGRTLYNLLYAPIAHIFHVKNIIETLVKEVCGKGAAQSPSPDHIASCELCSGYAKMRALVAKLNSKMAHVKDKATTVVLHSSFSSATQAVLAPDLASRIAVRQGDVFPRQVSMITGSASYATSTSTLILFNDVAVLVNGPGKEQVLGCNRFFSVAIADHDPTAFVLFIPSPPHSPTLTTELTFRTPSTVEANKWVEAFQSEIEKALSLHLSTLAPPEPDLLVLEDAAPSTPVANHGSPLDRVGVMAKAAKRRSTAIRSMDHEARQEARFYLELRQWIEQELVAEYTGKIENLENQLADRDAVIAANTEINAVLEAEITKVVSEKEAEEQAKAMAAEASAQSQDAFAYLEQQYAAQVSYAQKLSEELFKTKSELAREHDRLLASEKKFRKVDFVLGRKNAELDKVRSESQTLHESTISMFQEEIQALKRLLATKDEELEHYRKRIAELRDASARRPRTASATDGTEGNDGFMMVTSAQGFTEEEHFAAIDQLTRDLRTAFDDEMNAMRNELETHQELAKTLAYEKRAVEMQYHALATEMAQLMQKSEQEAEPSGATAQLAVSEQPAPTDNRSPARPQIRPDELRAQSKLLALEAEIRKLKGSLASKDDVIAELRHEIEIASHKFDMQLRVTSREVDALNFEIQSLRESTANEKAGLLARIKAYEMRLAETRRARTASDSAVVTMGDGHMHRATRSAVDMVRGDGIPGSASETESDSESGPGNDVFDGLSAMRRQCTQCRQFRDQTAFESAQWLQPVAGVRICRSCGGN